MSDRPITATYRLQLHASFGFGAATEIVPYLADLGISHLYLSPILQAAPGSMHGYDVVDHAQVSNDLGGRDALERLSATAHEHGLGLVVDIVPNHMALPTPLALNRPLWETLRLGRESETADWFDIDWDLGGGRVGLPVLGAPLGDVLAAGELTPGEQSGEPVIRYHDQVFPVAPGTAHGDLSEVLTHQHYTLAGWRQKDEWLGYRRFFDVDTLVAVRVELPHVFEATHRLLFELYDAGVAEGFRVDHPDGLADPQGYLEQLRDATGGAWVVVEKILEGDERLPDAWPTAGSTGYDAAQVITAALAPTTTAALDERWQAAGGEPSLHEVERAAKRLVLDTLFQPELGRLTRSAVRAATDASLPTRASRLRDGLAEILVQVAVYRAYLRPGHPADQGELDRLAEQVERAADTRPDLVDTLDLLHRLLTAVDTTSEAGRDLIVRFQQVCGPVMAKGIEDTTFYRWHRLVALNEVGGDPGSLDDPSAAPLHAWAEHQQHSHPAGLTTLSTHDTKRSEDVRARLLAVAGDLAGWDEAWAAVRRLADETGVDHPTAYLVMQTLLGAWPLDTDRLSTYLEKATREAKQHTSWNDPQTDYEARVLKLGQRCLDDPAVVAAIEEALASRRDAGRALTLAAKVLQLTLPGVPDVYQGCELVSLSLVDPDNRRPVDFTSRARRLARLDAAEPAADLDDEKLLVTSRTLRLRREQPGLFDGGATYTPLTDLPPELIGFLRGESVATVVSKGEPVDPDTGVPLPDGVWRDLLSGAVHGPGRVSAGSVLARLPVALLVKDWT